MEMFGMLFGAVFFVAIPLWIVLTKRHLNSGRFRNVKIAVIFLPAVLGTLSMAHWMFLDEPLITAATEGDVARVRSLLRWGASPNVKDEFGRSALGEASGNGHYVIVEMLKKAGAKE